MTQLTDNLDRVVRLGVEAWERLKKEDRNWNDWMSVGDALLIGREQAMAEAGTDKPEGGAYNRAFGKWLEANGFQRADEKGANDKFKTTRSRLFEVMSNRPAIETWRATLPQEKRMVWNHPTTVLAHWKAAITPRKPAGPSLKAKLADALKENVRLSEVIAEQDANREWDASRPTADEPADVEVIVEGNAAAIALRADDDGVRDGILPVVRAVQWIKRAFPDLFEEAEARYGEDDGGNRLLSDEQVRELAISGAIETLIHDSGENASERLKVYRDMRPGRFESADFDKAIAALKDLKAGYEAALRASRKRS